MSEYHPIREGLSVRPLTTRDALYLRGASAQTLRLRLKEKTGLDAFEDVQDRATLALAWQMVFLTDGLDAEAWLAEKANPVILESADYDGRLRGPHRAGPGAGRGKLRAGARWLYFGSRCPACQDCAFVARCEHPSGDRGRVVKIRAQSYERPLCEAEDAVRDALVLFHHHYHWCGDSFVPGFTSSERLAMPEQPGAELRHHPERDHTDHGREA